MIFTTGLGLFLAAYLAMLAQDALDLPQAAWRVVLAAFFLGLGLMAISVFAIALPIIWRAMP